MPGRPLFSPLPLHHILGAPGRRLHDGSLTFAWRSTPARWGSRRRDTTGAPTGSGPLTAPLPDPAQGRDRGR